ncbi:MAG: hypothetical protein ACFCUJ_14495 [Thiotrichales bacterium]
MYRVIAIVLMLVLPLQFAWSAMAGVHGHLGSSERLMGIHTHVYAHGHDHDASHGHHHEHQLSFSDTDPPEHGDDGHRVCHYHPVFTSILVAARLPISVVVPAEPILHRIAAYISRTSPPLDRPPLAFA